MPDPEPMLIRKTRDLFGIDIRSLALFRVGLGLLLLADLFNRAFDINAHYSDYGVLPRDVLLDRYWYSWYLSVHLLSGKPEVQLLLFAVSGLFAVSLLLGYRTRLSTVVSWFLLISLHSRNPMVLQGGDVLFRLLLFWGMFLPLGAAWSVDRAMDKGEGKIPKSIISIGAFAILMQVCYVYWFTVAHRNGHAIWFKEYTGVYYALHLDQFTTGIGYLLLEFPGFLKVLSFVTIWLETLGPFFAFIPWHTARFRTGTVLVFIGMHIGFALCMQLGLFSYISIVGWFLFLPSGFWDGWRRRLEKPERTGLAIYYDANCGFCRKLVHVLRMFLLLPETRVEAAEGEIKTILEEQNSWVVVGSDGTRHLKFDGFIEVVRRSLFLGWIAPVLRWKPLHRIGTWGYEWTARNRDQWFPGGMISTALRNQPLRWRSSILGSAVAAGLFAYVFLWNVRTLEFKKVLSTKIFRKALPQSANWIGQFLRIDQMWNMFSPYPLKEDGWYVIPAKLKDGTEVDLFRDGAEVSWEKPEWVAHTYRNQRWRKYMMNLWVRDNRSHIQHYLNWLCRRWNRAHGPEKQILNLRLCFMLEVTPPPGGESKVRKTTLKSHDCTRH